MRVNEIASRVSEDTMLQIITRRDIVGDVLTFFDYVEELERENERLKEENECLKQERNAEPREVKEEN